MTFILPELPYSKNALEPYISARTLEFHHGKHHNAYVNNLNSLTAGTGFEKLSLEEIIRKTAGDPKKCGIFNNAAQVWNHSFYWNSMKQAGCCSQSCDEPAGELLSKIENSFGSVEKFKEAFKQAGLTQFGSGWIWLVLDKKGNLQIEKTPNAELPDLDKVTPLLNMDVWEHAYYLDFQNARPEYIDTFLNKLINWDFAAGNIAEKKAAA